MTKLYEIAAVNKGGRAGTVEAGNLLLQMAAPTEMGGTGQGNNPEQLFAAGYAACFGSAVAHVLRARKLTVQPPVITVTVGLLKDEAGGYFLQAAIHAQFTGVDASLATEITKEAHTVCPYSKATAGNIPVTVTAGVE